MYICGFHTGIIYNIFVYHIHMNINNIFLGDISIEIIFFTIMAKYIYKILFSVFICIYLFI